MSIIIKGVMEMISCKRLLLKKNVFKACAFLLSVFIWILSTPLVGLATSPPRTRFLAVQHVDQAKSKWCWAASAEALGKYVYPCTSRSQWDAVSYVKGSGYPDEGSTVQENIQAIQYITFNKYSASFVGLLTFEQIADEIDKGHPVYSGGAHAVVFSGYNGLTESIQIVDPSPGHQFEGHSYTSMVNGTTFQSGVGRYIDSITITKNG